VIFRTRYEIHV